MKREQDMKTLEQLIHIVNSANSNQLWHMIYDFEMIGFYREDKQHKRTFVIECLINCYTTDINQYGTYDSDSIRMEKAVIEAMSHK